MRESGSAHRLVGDRTTMTSPQAGRLVCASRRHVALECRGSTRGVLRHLPYYMLVLVCRSVL